MADPTNSGLTLVETWRISNRANLRLLDALTDDQLGAIIQPRGKPVTSYFAHIHMARYYWLERRAPALAKGLMKVPAGSATRATLRKALIASSEAMAELFAEAERTGQIKGTKIGPLGFLGYALTHEGHHRGQILLHLKLAKKPVNREVTYSLWYWNKTLKDSELAHSYSMIWENAHAFYSDRVGAATEIMIKMESHARRRASGRRA